MTVGIRTRILAIGCALAALTAVIGVAGARADLVAPRDQCPGQQNIKASERAQEDAMRCLIDHARSASTKSFRSLERAAGRKAGDILDCGFSHTACGRPFDAYAKRFGYAAGTSGWKLGENLAWGKRKRGSARQVFKAGLASPPHRSTLLDGSFEHVGIGLKRGRFSGSSRAAVWVLQIGCRGC
jgi:hypothetical protein